jgi:polysaccharide export outer membrane protein
VRFLVRFAFFVVLVVALDPSNALGQSTPPGPVRLRAGDAVRLEVRDEPDLTGEYRVDESGRVLLPLIGMVQVAGRAFEDVRRDVDAAYGRELANGEARITPLLRIAVMGEVREPGLFPVDPTYTLADVLALAGGLGPEADHDEIELVREGQRVWSGTDAEAVALVRALQSGDQVIVGRRSWVSMNSPALIGAGASLVVAIVTTLLLRQ